MSDDVVYRYTGNGFRRGVPQRDLTARDVARMPPGLLKDVTGGERPMYTPVKTKAPDPPKQNAAGGAAPGKPATEPKESPA